VRLSHRRRLVLTTSTVSGLILAALFVAASLFYRGFEYTEEKISVRQTAQQALEAALHGGSQAEVKAATDSDPNVSLTVMKDGVVLADGGPQDVRTLTGSGRTWLAGNQLTYQSLRHGSFHVVAALPWARREEALRRFSITLALLWFPLVGLVAGAAALSSRATFRPLDELRRQADDARAGGLGGRLLVSGEDEYGTFATSLNGFLNSIENLVKNEEQFVADAAHELRTPLTALRGRIETTLLRDRAPEEYRKALGIVLVEAERLSDLVEALLGSATAAYARTAPALDLQIEVEQAHARWLDRFAEAGVGLEVSSVPSFAAVTPSEIGSVLDNLLGNALRASPPNSTCRIELWKERDKVRLALQDAGPGVPEELRERIFDRFVRGEESRNRATGGFGIGLSLCRRIVEGRGGTICVAPSEKGARFEVDLPKA
jgi:two-component system OmpR family sensor kinase